MPTTPLTDSFTLFFYDFKLNLPFKEYSIFRNQDSLWKHSPVKPDEIFLFNHVKDFLLKNSGAKENQWDENELIIFELRQENLSPQEKEKLFLFNSFFTKNHELTSGDTALKFQLFNDSSVLSPKLFISPLTSIGILSFGFTLLHEHQSLENLIQFNYLMRNMRTSQLQTIRTPKNIHPNAQPQELKINDALKIFQRVTESKDTHSWSFTTFTKFLLQNFEPDSVEEISKSSLQAFTYVQTRYKIPENELNPALFRLRKLYGSNFIPPDNDIRLNKEVIHPFEQIYFGASVEGSVILINEDAEHLPEFLKNFSDTVKKRYLWTYFLAYHQRISLIVAAGEISNLFSVPQKTDINVLTTLLQKLTLIQLKCMFNEISYFTQQNEYYYLCRELLRVPQLFEELSSELAALNSTLGSQWKQKEDEERLLLEEKHRNREKKFAILIGILVIPQIWYQMLSSGPDSWKEFIEAHSGIMNGISIAMWVGIGVVTLYNFVFSRE